MTAALSLLDPPIGALAVLSVDLGTLPKGAKVRVMLHPADHSSRALLPVTGGDAVPVKRSKLVELRRAGHIALLRGAARSRVRVKAAPWTESDDARLVDCIALGLDFHHWRHALPQRSFGEMMARRDQLKAAGRVSEPRPI